MIREVLHKHVAVGLNNGIVIEGFVQGGDEAYFRVVGWDNNVVIVRIEDISFARLSVCHEQRVKQPQPVIYKPIVQHSEMPEMAGQQLDEEGFAVGLPRGIVTTQCPTQTPIGQDDGTYEQPFVPRVRR